MCSLNAGISIPTPSQAFAAFFYVRPNSRVYGIALRAGFSRHWGNVTKSVRTGHEANFQGYGQNAEELEDGKLGGGDGLSAQIGVELRAFDAV